MCESSVSKPAVFWMEPEFLCPCIAKTKQGNESREEVLHAKLGTFQISPVLTVYITISRLFILIHYFLLLIVEFPHGLD